MRNSVAHNTIKPVPSLEKTSPAETLSLVHTLQSDPFAPMRLYTPLEKKSNLFIKRLIDLSCSIFLLIFLFSWLLPLVALLIKLDSKGPVFFLQKRNNKNGGVFNCFKFRTMLPNEDADLLPAYANDRRITKVGRVLRKYHLDELPQLLNVFLGDMSLIGPRPHMISDNEKYAAAIRYYALRHTIKPGITGLAQASGHYGFLPDAHKMQERLELDLIYIRDWSVKMDIMILCRTIGTLFR